MTEKAKGLPAGQMVCATGGCGQGKYIIALQVTLEQAAGRGKRRTMAMCPRCGKTPARDCGYANWDAPDFDCDHPDAENLLECPCEHTLCIVCIGKEMSKWPR